MRRGCRKSFTIYASPGSSFLGRISTSLGPFWVIFVSICPALINYNRASPPNGLRGAALVTFLKTRCGSGELLCIQVTGGQKCGNFLSHAAGKRHFVVSLSGLSGLHPALPPMAESLGVPFSAIFGGEIIKNGYITVLTC